MANPMMCLQNDTQTVRRVTRQPIVFQRPAGAKTQTPVACTKTKAAICFLCLFDGLRTPSIRRLSRKPRTICNKPLLTFDPSVFAPSSQNAIQDCYMESVKCTSDIVVDPSVQTVLQLVRKHSSTGPPERIILHYCGQGCNPPTADGSLYFFSDDHARYKPVKVTNLLSNCTGPVCVILDCPSAAILQSHFATKGDTIGFFACSQNEQLPISTDAPWDLFSRCLLSPYETALWWHTRRHSCVFERNDELTKDPNCFLKSFFYALLEAIAFDTQPVGLFETFIKDPAMLSLARGFVLAQRVMQSFNLHPVSIPQMKPTTSHDLWYFWDTAIDCAMSMPQEEAAEMIFKLFLSSFKGFPTPGFMPLFSFFIYRPETRAESVRVLLEYLDSHQDGIEAAARSNIPRTIIEMSAPSEATVLLLAKLLPFRAGSSPFLQQWPFWYKAESHAHDARAGMLAIICAISKNYMSSFAKISSVCIAKATECAPYSSILLGILMNNAGRLMNLPSFASAFRPMLQSDREDVRAGTVFLLGVIRDNESLPQLIPLLQDQSALVRGQAVVAVASIVSKYPDARASAALQPLRSDSDPRVKQAAEFATMNRLDEAKAKCNLFDIIIDAVKQNGFVKRYKSGLICNSK